MGIGAGIFLIAVGAIMDFAVKVTNTRGFNIHTIGIILMVVGVLGIALDLILFMPRRRRTAVYAPEARVTSRRTVVDDRDELV